MKTIYIHIGLGKTGTSSIQNHFAKNHSYYLKQDLHYIQCLGGESGSGHQLFAKSFITQPPAYMQIQNNNTLCRKQLVDEISHSNKGSFLISSENFQLASSKKVKKFFDSLSDKVCCKIILFVRSQDELAESEYNQIIKVRAEQRSFYNYTNEEFDGNFYKLAKSWDKYFGKDNIICHVFNASKKSIIKDFIECIPNIVPINNQKTREVIVNSSLCFSQSIIKRMLNILQPSMIQNQHIELPQGIHDAFSSLDIPAIFMNSTEAIKFRQKYDEINLAFNRRYMKIDSNELRGRRYSDSQRDKIYEKCFKLLNIITLKH